MLNQIFAEFRPIRIDRRQPVSNQIFEHLRAQIVSLALLPGTLLSRPAMAESFGVSQTPIRDALLRLEQEALVTVHPQSSTMVAPIDVEQAHEAQFLRISLECEVSRTIAFDPAAYDLDTPERLLAAMQRAWDDGQDKPTFVEKDLATTGRCSAPPATRASGSSSSSGAATSTASATSTSPSRARPPRSSPTTAPTSTP